jgi:hypothetical protein
MKPYSFRHERRGVWAVIDRIGIHEPNEAVAYLTNERDARRLATALDLIGIEAYGVRPCCLPVIDGSPQGAPCLLIWGHVGRCNAHPRGTK